MTLPVDEERAYYDGLYSRFLHLSDGALVCNRAILESTFNDPAQPAYERRALYQAAMEALTAEPLEGKAALDYGCGTGDWGLMLAGEGARVTLLDLSPVAIDLGLRRAAVSGAGGRVRGVARDAADLSCFADGEFDIIFGAFALHHTLKHAPSLRELLRVLKPGGLLVLVETYGNNRLLNAGRVLRRWASHEPQEQGEGIILNRRDLDALRPAMAELTVRPMNFLAMAKRLFRGRFARPWVGRLLGMLERTDRRLLAAAPFLAAYCGEALIVGRKRG